MESNCVEVYTDGSCLKNPGGLGGWALLLRCPTGLYIESAGADPSTTNNRMEMMAALEALRLIKKTYQADPPEKFIIHTDSEYVKKGMSEWISGWKKNGWINSQGKDVKNKEIWLAMEAEARGLQIEWRWVRGHAGNPLNERVDELAGIAARTQAPFYSKEDQWKENSASELTVKAKKTNSGVISIDVLLSDAEIAQKVRKEIVAAKGKIVRFRGLR